MPVLFSLKDKVAVVSGGASGIGRAISRCFARQGEGYQPILRDHYKARYERGVAFLKRLVNLPGRDRVYQRQTAVQMSRLPARPRLPDEYERVTP